VLSIDSANPILLPLSNHKQRYERNRKSHYSSSILSQNYGRRDFSSDNEDPEIAKRFLEFKARLKS
jgi:hypothetical protein